MQKGKISTFFSYKGGVGRSMTMANIAYILTSWGYKVLCIDGDLEAPGLHYYFGAKENKQSDGFLELLLSHTGKRIVTLKSIIKTIKINNYDLDFIYSGKKDNEYPRKLQKLDIEKLYTKYNFGSTIEEIFDQLRRKYDHILIDSRTGFTDIGAMLSIQLPDQLFLFCTTNHQGLYGIDEIAKKVTKSRSDLPLDKSKIVIIPIISSFAGMFEKALGEKWMNDFTNKLGYLFDDWRSPETDLRSLINELIIPFVPAWSFGENLPATQEDWNNKDNISYSFRNISSLIANDFMNNALFVKSPKIYSSLLKKKDFFISYSVADEQIANWIAWTLEEAGYNIAFQSWDLRTAGKSIISNINQSVENCERIIAILSPEYFNSHYTKSEWGSAVLNDPTGELGLLIPVIVRNCPIDGILKRLCYISLIGLDEEQAKNTLLQSINKFAKSNKRKSIYRRNDDYYKNKPHFPELLPLIWNLPHRNPNFTGRDKILHQLRASLIQDNNISLTQVSFYGLGGIGKTQIAIEYAYRYSNSYNCVWWIRAEEPSALLNDLVNLAISLDLPNIEVNDQHIIIEEVRKWLETHENWLLIFDNARDADSIRYYLPRTASGHVLITSRNPNWKSIVKPWPIEVWERNESIAFLQKRTGQSDEISADALVEALGNLPLALEQAAAYCDSKKKSFSDYLTLFNAQRAGLWDREKAPDGYNATVSTTWSLAFEEIRKTPMAEQLLSLCSIVAPDAIPRNLIETALANLITNESLTYSIDEFIIDEAYDILRSYSLINIEEKTISLHRLVQSVVRDQMNENIFSQCLNVIIQTLSLQFPMNGYNDPSSWPECQLLFPHAQQVIDYALYNNNQTSLDWSLLLNSMGLYLHGRGAYSEAEPLLKRSLEIKKMQFGQDHPNVAIGLNNLALLLTDEGKYAEAEPLIKLAMEIDKKQLGSESPNVATSLNNLALLLTDEGKYGQAEPLLMRALEIREKQLGPNHPDVALTLSNLALLMEAQRKYEQAEPLLMRALEISEKQLGSDHPNVATILNNLALLMKAQGEYAQAEPMFIRALEIQEKQLGGEHPHVASSLKNLGLLLTNEGKYTEAEPLIRRALAISEKTLGSQHPFVATTKESLEFLMKAQSENTNT